MNKIFVLLLAVTAVLFVKPVTAQGKAKWNEMEAFHEVMSKTFHPSEEGKLEPIRTRSQEMADKAKAWKSSSAPQGYNKKAVKKSLNALVKGANEINSLVKSRAADDILKKNYPPCMMYFMRLWKNAKKKIIIKIIL